jgi:hypothetical protein
VLKLVTVISPVVGMTTLVMTVVEVTVPNVGRVVKPPVWVVTVAVTVVRSNSSDSVEVA